jgi:protein-S-isoprenylcysteine O-methyltransferase Ste14
VNGVWPPAPNAIVVRAAALYVPIASVAALALWRRPTQRVVMASAFGFAWNVVALLALNGVATRAHWWSYRATAVTLNDMPVDLLLGWAVLWGAVPVMTTLARSWPIAVAAVAFDLLIMPMGGAVVRLHGSWLIGESVAVGAALVPSLALARATAESTRLMRRAAMQLVVFAGLVLYVLPSIVLEMTHGSWDPFTERPRWQFVVLGIVCLAPTAVAVQSVIEFAVVGRGTPFPLDPPTTLVTSGPYAYVANPMQLGGTALLLVLGTALNSPAMVGAAGMAVLFSGGFAKWNERGDLDRRFNDQWRTYRSEVRDWLPRFRPFAAPATVYVAQTCELCREIGLVLGHLRVDTLTVHPAEHASVPLRRITYVGRSGTSTGIAAIARCLEDKNLATAMLGWVMRLPVVLQLLQLISDATGGAPREVGPTDSGVAS